MNSNEILEAVKQMSQEQRKEFNALMQEAYMPKPQVKQLGTPLDRSPRDLYGRKLSPEEVYDREHPLEGIWPYGFSITSQVMGQDPVVRYYTDKEVLDHNTPIIDAWLEEKRRFFPDAKRPSVPRTSDSQNHYTFSR